MPRQASASAQFQGGLPSYLFISLWFIVIVVIIKAILLQLFWKSVYWNFSFAPHMHASVVRAHCFEGYFISLRKITRLSKAGVAVSSTLNKKSNINLCYFSHKLE